MNVDEALRIWHREQRWLAALDAWVSLDAALPESVMSVMNLAFAFQPALQRSQRGYVNNVRVQRNTLVHGGFSAPLQYDPEEAAHRLSDVVAVFGT